jgi:hypothetical protein
MVVFALFVKSTTLRFPMFLNPRKPKSYKKYKDMKSKLEKIFHDMRMGSLQKNADDTDEQR